MRRMLCLAVLAVGLAAGAAQTAEAQVGYGSPGYYPRAYYSQAVYGYGPHHYYYGYAEVPYRVYEHGRIYERGDEVYVTGPRVNVYYGRDRWHDRGELHIDVPYFRMHLRH